MIVGFEFMNEVINELRNKEYKLCIQDFHKIFMAGGVKSVTDPDHNEFVQ